MNLAPQTRDIFMVFFDLKGKLEGVFSVKNRAHSKSINSGNNEANTPCIHPTIDLNVHDFVRKMAYFTLLGGQLISAYDPLNSSHKFDSLVSRNDSIYNSATFAQDLMGLQKKIKNN